MATRSLAGSLRTLAGQDAEAVAVITPGRVLGQEIPSQQAVDELEARSEVNRRSPGAIPSRGTELAVDRQAEVSC
jgi:hypothetical protein